MSSSQDSIPPGWEEGAASSPETLPPGFENPTSLCGSDYPPQENPSTSPPSPLPAPQEIQNHLSFPSRNPTQEDGGSQYLPPQPSLHESRSPFQHPSLRPPPQEGPVSLSQPLLQEVQGPSPPSQLPQGNLGSLNPPPPQPHPEMGQMVCGSCNELLSYPRGLKYVQCACCQATNFVLEAHQVGIVKCGKCSVLLMYPYASKSLRCSSCHFVTDIGCCGDVDAKMGDWALV